MERIYVSDEEPRECNDVDTYVRCLLDILLRLEAEKPGQLERIIGGEFEQEAA